MGAGERRTTLSISWAAQQLWQQGGKSLTHFLFFASFPFASHFMLPCSPFVFAWICNDYHYYYYYFYSSHSICISLPIVGCLKWILIHHPFLSSYEDGSPGKRSACFHEGFCGGGSLQFQVEKNAFALLFAFSLRKMKKVAELLHHHFFCSSWWRISAESKFLHTVCISSSWWKGEDLGHCRFLASLKDTF